MQAELLPKERLSRQSNSRFLLLLFILSLPLVNPWVRGDGVGYYAYIRSLLVEHKLDFQNDWRAANRSFTLARVGEAGEIEQMQYTPTGHLDNHFAVGPAILWAPFLIPVHFAMTALQSLGIPVRADGFSRPYIIAMALATALYGFLGLWFSFQLACRYTEQHWALLATLSLWFASSLPVYMYFNPSWSHAHSVFVVAMFLWYWERTRQTRTWRQWGILGMISGLMLDVYYVNIALLLVPLLESLARYWRTWRAPVHAWQEARRLFLGNLLYCCATVIAFSPTLITRQIIYGHPLEFGYGGISEWHFSSPSWGSVLFSSDHGLLVWTPIVIPALLGLVIFLKRRDNMARYLLAACLGFCYLIAIDPCWDGISSFGNRKFLSLTPVFVLSLAVAFSEFARVMNASKRALAIASSVAAVLIVWNLAFIFQWGTHLVPSRGPISWKQMVHNQFFVVPQQAAAGVKAYVENRRGLMQQIEQQDVSQVSAQQESHKQK
jgi:Dolichyl-phosphate-mannose-protein mannosyltransferase